MYYLAADRGAMAVEVRTAPTFTFGKPTLLFRMSEAVTVMLATTNVSRDGQRVVIAVPSAPTLQQITVFDRQRNVLSKVGDPGHYIQPMLSSDGTRVAAVRIVPQTGNEDIWTFDVASSKGTPVTSDVSSADFPCLVSGRQAGGLCFEARELLQHLSRELGRNWQCRGAIDSRAPVPFGQRQPRRPAFRVHDQRACKCVRALTFTAKARESILAVKDAYPTLHTRCCRAFVWLA
jgi:hypothetical protein